MPRISHAFRLIPSRIDPNDLSAGEPQLVAPVVAVFVPPVAAARRTRALAVQNSLAISKRNGELLC
jgi:hypothetical protein